MSAGLILLALTAALPDSARYKVDVSFSQKASVGSQEAHIVGFLTLMERDTAGGRIATFRIDSLVIPPGKPLPASMQGNPALARGITYRGMIQKGAVVGGFQISTPHPQAKLLAQGLDNLYPGFRTSLTAGTSWSDTVKVNTVTPVVQDKTTIVDWQVVSLTDSILVALGTTRGTMSMRQPSASGERKDEITMTGTRHLSGPVAGPMRSATVSSTQQQLTTLPGNAPIPVTIVTSTSITRLP